MRRAKFEAIFAHMRRSRDSKKERRASFAMVLFCLLLAGSSASVAMAPGAGSEGAPHVAVVDDGLKIRLDAMVDSLEAQRRQLHIPGMAIAVVKDGEVLLTRGFGVADMEKGKAVTPKTLFAIGSTTKAFTATLLGMLVDEGKVGWDDPVAEFLPYFHPVLDTKDDSAKLTLRDLLAHRSGFARMGILWAGGGVPSKEILLTANAAEPWAAFRKGFHYNNVMFLAAGMAGAAAADTHWGRLLEKRILEPLGMEDTNISVERTKKSPNAALGYEWDEENEIHKRRPMRVLDTIAPAGAINSNAEDMAQWLRFLLAGGRWQGKQLIRPETLQETWSPQITIAEGVDYGLGWMLREWSGRKEIEHGGNIDGFAAEVALIPEEKIGFALLMNVSYSPLQQSARSIVWNALLDPEKNEEGDTSSGADTQDAREGEEKNWSELTGEYIANFAAFKNAVFTVSVTDGRLAVDVPGQMNYLLEPADAEGKRAFEVAPAAIQVSFERDAKGRVVSMRLHQAGYDFELPRKGVEIEPPVPLDKLEPYLGTYHSEKLDRDITVVIDAKRLAMDIPEQMVVHLDPPKDGDEAGKWTFRIKPELSVLFRKDDAGRIIGMTHYRADEVEEELPRVDDAQPVDLPSVDEIFKLRKVAERSAAYLKATPLRLSGTVRIHQAGLEGTFEGIIEGDDRQRTKVDFGNFGYEISVLDGDYAARESSFQPSENLSGMELRLAQQSHMSIAFADWRRTFETVEVVEESSVDGRDAWVLRLKNPDTPEMTLSIAKDNGDVLASKTVMVAGGGAVQVPISARYADHRDLLGFRMPFRIITENEPSGRTTLQIDSVSPRVELPDSPYRIKLERPNPSPDDS